MGRHALRDNTGSLPGRTLLALLATMLLIGALIWFIALRDTGSDDAVGPSGDERTCVSGELMLPVAAADAAIAEELIGVYNESLPEVRDYCITAQFTASLQEAAVYIAPNTPITHQQLAAASRSAALAEPQPVFADEVGVAAEVTPDTDVDVKHVRFPVDNPGASALVASLLAREDNAAIEALTHQRIDSVDSFAPVDGQVVAISQRRVPERLQFRSLDASVVYTAIPLNSGETIDENQARAGQDFARFSSERFPDDVPDQPVIPELVWAAALPEGGEALTTDGASPTDADEAAVAADGNVTDSLFLLDTSESMAPYLQAANAGIKKAAAEVISAGHRVGLWNYSSPLNPGVEVGYRRNVALTDSDQDVIAVLDQLQAAGQPRTREALDAAVDELSSGPAESAQQTRVIVITTGTADGGTDGAFSDALRQKAGERVVISVVHVGDRARDVALEQVASSYQEVGTNAELEAALIAATGTRSSN